MTGGVNDKRGASASRTAGTDAAVCSAASPDAAACNTVACDAAAAAGAASSLGNGPAAAAAAGEGVAASSGAAAGGETLFFKSSGAITRRQLQALSELSAPRPLVLTVAGLDSGGGAGITADVLTIHDLGAWALPCVTALTVQSLKRVRSAVPADAALFRETLETARADWEHIAAVKVGLVTQQRILEELLSFLKTSLPGVPVVWDPVLCATAGRLESADLQGSLAAILSHTAIFTPNLPEALELAGWDEARLQREGFAALGRVFLSLGAQAVILKGGHRQAAAADGTAGGSSGTGTSVEANTGSGTGGTAPEVCDFFVSEKLSFVMQTPAVPGDGAHGGGCALSSALAALLAQGYAPEDAAVLARAYVYRGIREPDLPCRGARPPLGHHGMPADIHDLPRVLEQGFPPQAGPFPACPLKLGFYPVVDTPEKVEALCRIGVRTIQLRIKDAAAPQLLQKIMQAAAASRRYHARLFVDDHYELAARAGAYGVHLGMEDLREADLEAIKKAGLRLGVSTHGPYEMLKALQLQPSYIALGHIFPTDSKLMPSRPQGLMKLRLECSLIASFMPVVAIGGIKLHNLDRVLQCGVPSVALISAISRAENPAAAAAEWLRLTGSGGDEPSEPRAAGSAD